MKASATAFYPDDIKALKAAGITSIDSSKLEILDKVLEKYNIDLEDIPKPIAKNKGVYIHIYSLRDDNSDAKLIDFLISKCKSLKAYMVTEYDEGEYIIFPSLGAIKSLSASVADNCEKAAQKRKLADDKLSSLSLIDKIKTLFSGKVDDEVEYKARHLIKRQGASDSEILELIKMGAIKHHLIPGDMLTEGTIDPYIDEYLRLYKDRPSTAMLALGRVFMGNQSLLTVDRFERLLDILDKKVGSDAYALCIEDLLRSEPELPAHIQQKLVTSMMEKLEPKEAIGILKRRGLNIRMAVEIYLRKNGIIAKNGKISKKEIDTAVKTLKKIL
jgi:hypothetical protein